MGLCTITYCGFFFVVGGLVKVGQKSHVKCGSPGQQVLLTLVQLKLNNSIFQLSYMFGVSHGTETFIMWIHMLVDVLQWLLYLPSKHMVKCNPAPCDKDWPSIVIVPSDLQTKKELFNNYKQQDPAKFLVGTAPNMTVIFISQGWSGRASDKTITLSSEDLMQGWH